MRTVDAGRSGLRKAVKRGQRLVRGCCESTPASADIWWKKSGGGVIPPPRLRDSLCGDAARRPPRRPWHMEQFLCRCRNWPCFISTYLLTTSQMRVDEPLRPGGPRVAGRRMPSPEVASNSSGSRTRCKYSSSETPTSRLVTPSTQPRQSFRHSPGTNAPGRVHLVDRLEPGAIARSHESRGRRVRLRGVGTEYASKDSVEETGEKSVEPDPELAAKHMEDDDDLPPDGGWDAWKVVLGCFILCGCQVRSCQYHLR